MRDWLKRWGDKPLRASREDSAGHDGLRPAGSSTERADASGGPVVYIISYPKCGRTWLRVLLGTYLSARHGGGADTPVETVILSDEILATSGLGRVIFTHDGAAMMKKKGYRGLSDDKSVYAGQRVILLGRDIRDTLVSAYFQAVTRAEVFEGSIAEFIRSERYGVGKLLSFYGGWLEGRRVPERFAFFRYEDLHARPEATLRGILEIIGESEIDEALIRSTVEACRFDKLRKAESERRFDAKMLKPGDGSDPESFKLRRGKVGGYADYLSPADIAWIDDAIRTAGFDFEAFGGGEAAKRLEADSGARTE